MKVAFEPPPGLVSNDTVYATPGAWGDVRNLRFVEGRVETLGGVQTFLPDALTGVCRNVFNWTNAQAVANLAFGTHSKLFVYFGGVLADITPAGLAAGAIDTSGGGPGYGTGTWNSGPFSVPSSSFNLRTWSLDTWGETLLAVPRSGTLYQWTNGAGSPAAAIAGAPDEINCMIVTPERQVLAGGCNEEVSNDFNALCIRGCDIEDLTDWATSSSNNAFEHILEGGGQILAMRMISSYVGVWTDNSLHQGQFLGNPDQTYRFDRIDSNCGIIGPNAVCVLNGVAYWVGKDKQIRAWTPGARPTIIPCPIWSDFADNLSEPQSAKIVAVSNSRFDEVWFHYPDGRDGMENSRYIALSTTNGTWFRGDIARSAACDAGVLNNPVAVGPDSIAYYHEVADEGAGNPLPWMARSAAQYLDEAESALQVRSMSPDFKEQDSPIMLTVHTRSYAQGAVTSKGPYILAVGARKKDFRLTGKIIELEFAGTGKARFGKPTFDAVPIGRR